ncbi:bifunctional phosphopantothenoylcysteine decarboxylase/phosphopantothenate--cysteine ligase CoaBC [Xanthobacteraceae bacterium Astr-EGSB]|uniref:bifunctional phosphopantothenoylcysteine decarboxylase/phosphopantothenate--cysteine ligase CoaBC n=1 Tax=Astrobacterium formosum TaxID=3069710 RepID=UPI0027AF6275|nr:bifunctional phosphopantothenoylcysteine decarboxylase/phosphopantothenate--cysteine ligase CoaBC [Xanthobacteraceae bacterium Astr-EGSB]
MASLTIRKLDEALKAQLRLRAAKNGRSMEEEIRMILAAAGDGPAAEVPQDESAPSPPLPAPDHGAAPRRALLIISGGIAAYKSLDLIRRLKERGFSVRVVMTKAAQEFVTPLAAGALAGSPVHTDLFDARTEFDVGHIRLARDTDLIIVAPATADLMAKMAQGLASDLASTVLLATDKPVLMAPAMNPLMWAHKATQRNLARLIADGIVTVGPNAGEMAERGETGVGRMAEPLEIATAAEALMRRQADRPLAGKRVLVTSGPTREPIDPVRYIANRSSGKQGHAIARAAAEAGATVTLVSGPVRLADPPGAEVVHVESARQMLAAVENAMPVDIAIFAAAVADWRVASASEQKIKKGTGGTPTLELAENPDILATIARRAHDRPALVIGFAAETEHVVAHAKAKLAKKGCDWILANDVSSGTGVMGGDRNTIHVVTAAGVETWPTQSKDDVARMLMGRLATAIGGNPPGDKP